MVNLKPTAQYMWINILQLVDKQERITQKFTNKVGLWTMSPHERMRTCFCYKEKMLRIILFKGKPQRF